VSLDAFANFAISSLVTGITAGATSLTVTTGEGTKFPAVSFNATIWNSTDFASAYLDTTAEVVRVTVIAGDVFTITRAQEGTAAAAHNTAAKTYKILAGLTALNANKLLDKTGDTMTGSLTLSSGNLSVSAGTVSASGNISATSGSLVAGRRVGIGVSGIQTTSVALTVSSPGLQLWNPGAGQTRDLASGECGQCWRRVRDREHQRRERLDGCTSGRGYDHQWLEHGTDQHLRSGERSPEPPVGWRLDLVPE
jgi:hypothetical protein